LGRAELPAKELGRELACPFQLFSAEQQQCGTGQVSQPLLRDVREAVCLKRLGSCFLREHDVCQIETAGSVDIIRGRTGTLCVGAQEVRLPAQRGGWMH
jgi:hypothetical protein